MQRYVRTGWRWCDAMRRMVTPAAAVSQSRRDARLVRLDTAAA